MLTIPRIAFPFLGTVVFIIGVCLTLALSARLSSRGKIIGLVLSAVASVIVAGAAAWLWHG